MNQNLYKAGLLAVALAVLAGCQQEKEAGAAAEDSAQQQAPSPTVGVLTAQSEAITLYENLPARLEPSREAVVQAQANGVVQKRLFREGSKVSADQALYQIDDAVYRADLQTAKAKREQAITARDLARANVRRYAPLVKAKAISSQQYEQAQAEERTAQANINAAEAAINQAEIMLGYTKVKAPISGQIGKALVSEGALVSATQATPLAVIQQNDPLELSISQSANKILALKKAFASGALAQTSGELKVDILLEDGSVYDHQGKMLFAEQTVDPATGEVILRAEVPNPDQLLLPGLYVRVKIPTAQLENAYLIPQRAVTRGDKGDSVLVVNEDNTFAPKSIEINQAQGGNWIVSNGLEPGDKVIVDGQMGLRGAKTVQTTPWSAEQLSESTGQ
ncbi:efflux RND transporter periplasmic adaptor subunit [Suttonella sp. R2A3]|uniref:efflux RND transporter periplasmic adaptor subunit n=1 Tax=Suttonella sp. R2A3 TaxID=2908648 RepID=UPI001F409E25|nr:efflux RND transporter periplasmic adaptor subunit [Suttonella sp. R2A3]UJF23744.1 efflux RND transporter periplasmic adaptor subunit [Suttonella sp. R2A3]